MGTLAPAFTTRCNQAPATAIYVRCFGRVRTAGGWLRGGGVELAYSNIRDSASRELERAAGESILCRCDLGHSVPGRRQRPASSRRRRLRWRSRDRGGPREDLPATHPSRCHYRRVLGAKTTGRPELRDRESVKRRYNRVRTTLYFTPLAHGGHRSGQC